MYIKHRVLMLREFVKHKKMIEKKLRVSHKSKDNNFA